MKTSLIYNNYCRWNIMNEVCIETWELAKYEKDGMHTSLKNTRDGSIFSFSEEKTVQST